MKTIAKIINIFGGVKNLHASIENPPYMRLVIEDIGIGPRGHQPISVAHYFTQNAQEKISKAGGTCEVIRQ